MRCIRNRTNEKDAKPAGKKAKKKVFYKLIKLMLPYWKSVLLACVLILLLNLADIAKPYIIKIVMDDYMAVPSSPQSPVIYLSLIYMFLSLIGGMLSYLQVNIINSVGQSIIYSLREKVFSTIHYLPLSYFNKHSSGSLVTRATNDIAEIGNLYTDIIFDLFKDVFLLVGIVVAMFLLEPSLALFSLVVLPVIYIVFFTLKRKIRKSFFSMKHYIGRINGFIAESLSGMKLIQAFGAEGERLKMFQKLNKQYFNSTLVQVNLRSVLRPASELLQDLAIALLIWRGMNGIFNQTIEIGILYAMITYTRRFFRPVSDLAEMYDSIQSALVSTERVLDLIEQEELLEKVDLGIEKTVLGSIEFVNVWFAYNENDWVLKDVSFCINRGQKAALIGETGAGKTTIINLIFGFYRIQRGKILIDGVDIYEIRPSNLRKSIALVLQDVFLFSGDIKNNITLKDLISDSKIKEAIKASGTDSFIDSNPKGIYAPVTERGGNYSAGQRQLISLARAVAHDPVVYILDEATANVDTHTEKQIQKAIENATRNHTSMVIAHRLSTIRDADLIIVIENGVIYEMGSEEELFEKNGYYQIMIQR